MARHILTINAGSSSLRLVVFDMEAADVRVAEAHIERVQAGGHVAALARALRDVATATTNLSAISHRIVHGGTRHVAPERVTPPLVASLRALSAVAPDHMPPALDAIDAARLAFPDVPQVACFDTAFHAELPVHAAMLPLPRELWDRGIRRFGFHGLSCEFVMAALRRIDPAAAEGRVVIAHLGNGSSVTAVRNGRSVDTTMGFSPNGGVMMGTRPGDVDPGVLLHLLREGAAIRELDAMLTHQSGLLGVSGVSADMRDLLAAADTDPHAADAIALYCYSVRKSLGGMLAVLGGIDTLVFTGGIGQHAPPVRWRICAGLEPLGIELDDERNSVGAGVISRATPREPRTIVRVIATDEDLVLARHACTCLDEGLSHV